LAVFATAFIANAFGYVSLSELLGNAALRSAYLAVILYAAMRIADGLIMGALSIYPLAMLRMVNRHRYLLWSRARRVVQWAALLWWGSRTLDLLSMRASFLEKTREILTGTFGPGDLEFSLQRFIAFGVVAWAAFLISRFCRFALEEEVYPRVQLSRGLPYAVSTMLHYTILVAGFFAAAAAAKIDMTKFTIVAGAVGVGLGFGLQNIINNFVSGLILLFERPIKVGDVIQLGDVAGSVQSIGIRASIVRTGSGSELIVPNGMLISGQVTNWTLSNRQRGIDIPLRVAYGTDPDRVIALLVEIAKTHPLVMDNPPPVALFSGFGTDSLEFVLHAWTNDFDQWAQIRSDLGVAINAAFLKENIPIPHP
jgi:small-conductance mechanosensitive channel